MNNILIAVEAAEEHNLIWKRWIRYDRFNTYEGYVWPAQYMERVIDAEITFTPKTERDPAHPEFGGVIKHFGEKTSYGIYLALPRDTYALPRDPETEPEARPHECKTVDGIPITLTAAPLIQMPGDQLCIGCEKDQLYVFSRYRFFNVYCQDIVEGSTDPESPYLRCYVLILYIPAEDPFGCTPPPHVDQHPIDCWDLCYTLLGETCEDGELKPPVNQGQSLPLFKKDRKNNDFNSGDIIEIEYNSHIVTFTPRDNCHVIAFYQKVDGCRDIRYSGYDIEILFGAGKFKMYHLKLDPCTEIIPDPCDYPPGYLGGWEYRSSETINVPVNLDENGVQIPYCWQSSWDLAMWSETPGCTDCPDDNCEWQYRTIIVGDDTI